MGKHLDQLRKIEKCPTPCLQNLQNPVPGGFDGFVGTPPSSFEKYTPLEPEHFRAEGVNVLPDDLLFLRCCLPIKVGPRNTALDHYVSLWLEAMEREPVGHKKENAGRFAANTWLRESTR